MARGKILNLSPSQIVDRALSQINAPILYHLEYPNGGTDPDLPSPADPHVQQADCIGFAAWASGFDRYCPSKPGAPGFPLYDGYINTDSMIEESQSPGLGRQRWFVSWHEPRPGMMIVGHTYTKLLRKRIGHIGVITAVHDATKPDGIEVVHCSPSNYQYTRSKSAIWKTNAGIWFNYYPQHYYITLVKGTNVQ